MGYGERVGEKSKRMREGERGKEKRGYWIGRQRKRGGGGN